MNAHQRSPQPVPPQPVDRLLAPFREFAEKQASGGVVLMAAAVVALLWANSPAAEEYFALWETTLSIGLGDFALAKPLHLWINDGLMAVFFLLVGLEIKREILVGELASPRRAVLPIAAAVGGAIVPAAIFIAVSLGDPEAARGWGVPMATDIAFALGVLALLGSRVNLGLRIFLTAFAIVDDLLAVAVITVFYTTGVSAVALAAAAGVLASLLVANRLGVRRPLVYALLGFALWVAILQSGVHATIAGVLLALTIPARTRVNPEVFVAGARRAIASFEERATGNPDEEHHAALWELEEATEQAQAPMLRMEHALQPWVAFLIVPLFALANAGVRLGGDLGAVIVEPVVLGILLGLVIGKQVGITLAVALVVRAGLTSLPDGVSWRQVYGAGWLGAIGFTMSLFIADLAYAGSPLLAHAKIGILLASIVGGAVGYLVLRSATGRRADAETRETAEG